MNSSTIQDTVNIIGNSLSALAEKLKMPAEQLFGWAVQNNYAIAFGDIAFVIIAVLALIPYIKFVKWGMKNPEGSSWSWFYAHEGASIATTFTGVALGIFFIIGVRVFVGDAIPRLVAPQFHALQDLMGMLK